MTTLKIFSRFVLATYIISNVSNHVFHLVACQCSTLSKLSGKHGKQQMKCHRVRREVGKLAC